MDRSFFRLNLRLLVSSCILATSDPIDLQLAGDKFCFAFIDCDIYESAEVAFKYIKEKMAPGGFIMIDDFTSIDKNGNYIAKSFFSIFESKDIIFFDTYSNGQTFRVLN